MNNNVVTSRQTYQYGDQKIEYTIVKSRRRKTSEIIVDEDEIILRTPFRKSIAEVEKLVDSKIKWIVNKQKDYREKRSGLVKPTFSEGSTLPYLGRKYEILIKGSNNGDKIEFNRKFITSLEMPYNRQGSRIKSLYEDWLYNQAKMIFEEKVEHFSKIIDVNPKRTVIKNLKNRWGSATKKGTINLNYNLIKAPIDIVDYVIIHELCHLKIKKHSHHFWNLLTKYVVDYKAKIEWLNVNAKYLI